MRHDHDGVSDEDGYLVQTTVASFLATPPSSGDEDYDET
jgi:hypothetical protein